jgi:hypothetical protein
MLKPIAAYVAKLVIVGSLLAIAGCTDSRGLNTFEAYCVDREGQQQGTSKFRACAEHQRALFEFEFRRANRIVGTL